MEINQAARSLEALGNPTRLGIYRLLVKAGDSGLAVGAVQAKLDMAASTLSHHIKALVVAGLVVQKRQGTSLICYANYAHMASLVQFLGDECCSGVDVSAISEDEPVG